MGGICMESDGADDCAAPLKRSFVVRVASSAERRVPDSGAEASGASRLAGCVGGNGGKGVVAHPATTASTPGKARILEMNIAGLEDLDEMTRWRQNSRNRLGQGDGTYGVKSENCVMRFARLNGRGVYESD
jgi:hypothetical protein